MTTAYCVKCKKKQEMKNPKEQEIKGKIFGKGQCPVCRTNMSVVLRGA